MVGIEKHFVIDLSNLALLNPEAVFTSFAKRGVEAYVDIPYPCLTELEGLKNRPGEMGRNAREAFRILRSYESKSPNNLFEGVQIKNKDLWVKVYHVNKEGVPEDFRGSLTEDVDDMILKCALNRKSEGKDVEVVTNDNALLIKASGLRLEAEDWKHERAIEDIKHIYHGWRTIAVNKETVDYFKKNRVLAPRDICVKNPMPNEFFCVCANETYSQSGVYDQKSGNIVTIDEDRKVYGILARNMQQKFALSALLNPNIPIVHLLGEAGTGKTLMAIAAAMEMVENSGDKRRYSSINILRPIVTMGEDIGYLPGSKDEKMKLWMQPMFDNLEYLLSLKFLSKESNIERLEVKYDKSKYNKRERQDKKRGGREFHKEKNLPGSNDPKTHIEYLIDEGIINLQAPTYIRGRSIPHSLIIVDEAQNLSPLEVKTIATRVGEGSKIILTGDMSQIDRKGLNDRTNGICYSSERFKPYKEAATVYLTEGERSPLATLASKIL